MQIDILSGIMNDYDEKCSVYIDFTVKVKDLVKNLLGETGIHIFNIEFRTKEKDRLQKKLAKAEPKYQKLSDVTDISGIRIITYFADDVDVVANIIEKEFDIDWDNSVDKRSLLDPDRFGYISLHYVSKLSESRLKLTEYRRFVDCKVEIQIRSILQHTWAEIEHDLGYKAKVTVPKEIRRRFSQLAGLLELADDEFMRIRNDLVNYESSVKEKMSKTPESLAIDQVSLSFYIKNSSLVRTIESDIVSNTKVRLSKEKDLTVVINRLYYAGFETIDDIETYLKKFQKHVIYFAHKLIARGGNYLFGVSIVYLCYVRVASEGGTERIIQFLDNIIGKDMPRQGKEDFARALVSWYKDIA